jgi:hypothetical protein
VPPGPVDADGEATESSREELELFFELVADVIAEEGEPRQFVLKSPCLPATVRPPAPTGFGEFRPTPRDDLVDASTSTVSDRMMASPKSVG